MNLFELQVKTLASASFKAIVYTQIRIILKSVYYLIPRYTQTFFLCFLTNRYSFSPPIYVHFNALYFDSTDFTIS